LPDAEDRSAGRRTHRQSLLPVLVIFTKLGVGVGVGAVAGKTA